MHLGPLESLPPRERARLRELAQVRRWERDASLYRAGDAADCLWVVQAGVVGVRVASPGGAPTLVTVLGAASVFGATDLVGPRVRTAGVVALTSAVTVSVSMDAIDATMRRSPELAAAVIGILTDAVRRLADQVIEARHDTQAVRLRRLLVHLPAVFGQARVPLNQTQIAQLIGAQRTTACELLAAEAALGRIRTGRGWVEVLDEAGLRSGAEGLWPVPDAA